MIDHLRDVERDCLEPLRRLRGFRQGIWRSRWFVTVDPRQEVRNPAAAAFGCFPIAGLDGGTRSWRLRARRLLDPLRLGRADRFDAPRRYRLRGAAATHRSRLGNIVGAARSGYDLAQFFERLDLIGDGPPHGGRLLRRLLRKLD